MNLADIFRKFLPQQKRALTWQDVFKNIDGPQLTSGITINEEKSLRVVAVYACVSYIADFISSLPKFVYRRLDKGREKAVNHAMYDMINSAPNPRMDDQQFVQTLTGHVLLWGNAFAEIERERDGSGMVTALWPLRPDAMEIQLYNGEIYYWYHEPNGERRQILRQNMFHLRGLGSDGLIGYSRIGLAREAVGLAMAEEEYRSRFFGNNASPGGVLEAPGVIGDPERLRNQWQQAHGGLSNSHRVAVLEYGVKWHQVGIPAKDIEFIEGRRYQKAEIATLFKVKPYKIGILEPGTVSFASIEQQALDSYTDTMLPWVTAWEKELNKLFTERDRKRYYVKFLFDGIQRADSKSRAETLQIWRSNGIINADDWLELEDRNPLPDGQGQDYWMPSNFTIIGEERPASPPTPDLTMPMNGNGNGAGMK